jgi:hypothetical protein
MPDWLAGYAQMNKGKAKNQLYKAYARHARVLGLACRIPHWRNGHTTVVKFDYGTDTSGEDESEKGDDDDFMPEDGNGHIIAHKRRNKINQNSEDELDYDEEEEEEEEEECRPPVFDFGIPCKTVGCSKFSIPGNFKFCGDHRDYTRKRKRATEKSVQGHTYAALPSSMQTNQRWALFLGNAQRRNKEISITHRRWLVLASSLCAYCNARGADFFNGLDCVVPEDDYTLENSVPCCNSCNTEKNDLELRQWMNRKGRPATESKSDYKLSLLHGVE